MGILVNQNQIGGGSSNSSHNIGDIFYTTRTDNSLNGAVECNGNQYNFSDFDSNLQNLLNEGKLPYVSIGEFDSMVSEKGWCDKIGYGTPKMVKIYPIGNDTEPAQMYIELTDQQYESFNTILRQCNDGDILPYRLYDIDTKELLEGYYIKCIVATSGTGAHFQAYDNNNDEFGYFVNEPLFQPDYINGEFIWYETIPDPDKSQADPTTYFKVPKLSAYIIQKENIPVIGNGITLGFTDGSSNYGFSGVNSSPARTLLTTGADYGSTVGSVHVSDDNPNKTVGITTDPTKSGIISDLSNNSFTGRVMIQLFNSTTDTAVATCNQVLADVSALNQGDYVIETQLPTEENNYTWYRLYKSGWVEQGKTTSIGNLSDGEASSVEDTFIITMANTNYQVITTPTAPNYSNRLFANFGEKTTTGLLVGVRNIGGTTNSITVNWQVSGMSAQK